jgi:glycosyltransferase involved in cell wall biosynthesis
MGYGRAGVKIAEALVRAGVDVYDIQDSPTEPVALSPGHVLERAGVRGRPEGTRAKHTNVVCWVATAGHSRGWWEGQHAGLLTMWEATKLPESFRDTLHEFDTVLVPSMQNVELFSQYNPNVRYVPLGIDPADWHYTPRPEIGNEFRFLIGGSGNRKGTDLAFDAFRAVFGGRYSDGEWTGKGPAPRLVMKQPKPEEGLHAPWVDLISGRITGDEERTLYEMAHCYVQPSRGEGFGLQPLQAIAQGLPTILTNAHGHAGYAHLGIPLSATEVEAGYFMFGNPAGMKWWEPDLEELCEAMHDVYENYEPHRVRAEISAGRAVQEWSWARSAEAFVAAFDGQLTVPGPGQHEWHTPTAKLFLVRVNRRWSAQIGDMFHVFDPGCDYYETADVKRILFESGLLDPSCLERMTPDGINIELGLTEVQLEAVPHYRAEHAYCPTCGQQVNTQRTLADTFEAEMAAR